MCRTAKSFLLARQTELWYLRAEGILYPSAILRGFPLSFCFLSSVLKDRLDCAAPLPPGTSTLTRLKFTCSEDGVHGLPAREAAGGGVISPAARMESRILWCLRFSIFISLRVLADASLQPSEGPFRLPLPNTQYVGFTFDKSITRPDSKMPNNVWNCVEENRLLCQPFPAILGRERGSYL